MTYFCDVHIQSRRDQAQRIFVVIPEDAAAKMEIPNLTKEILKNNLQYQEFVSTCKPKLVMADYTVYSTEYANMDASTHDEVFLDLIESGNVQKIAHAELAMDSTRDRIIGRKRRKSSPALRGLLIGCLVLAVFTAFCGGRAFGKLTADVQKPETFQKANEDGLLIPEQQYIAAGQEQLTISIDRSYSAVPTEDLQLKGAVVNGAAAITLPEFDREDYFTHVPGYTWGFSTKPDGDKIEYYGGKTYSLSTVLRRSRSHHLTVRIILRTFRAIHGDSRPNQTATKSSITARKHTISGMIPSYIAYL